MAWRRRAVSPGALLAALLSGCVPNCAFELENQGLINRLRVVGAVAEPAEIPWTLEGDPSPVRLTALAVDPNGGGRAVTATFFYCPPLTEPPRLTRLSDFPPLFGPAEADCPAEGAAPLPRDGALGGVFDVLEVLRRYGKPSAFDGGLPPGTPIPPSGFSLLEGLAAYRVGFEVSAGEERVRGYRTLLPTPGVPNENPVLEGIEIDGVPLTDEPLVSVGTAKAHLLRALPAAGAAQTFVLPDGRSQTETLLYSFHATAGDVQLRALDRPDAGPNTLLDEPRAQWWPPTDDPQRSYTLPAEGVEVHFYAVVRDGRGGVGWITRKVRVVPVAP
jgi:hypothetical protein